MAAKNRLVCQGCKQPVRVKAGKRRRWHFAHKHRKNCPLESASPALIEARRILFEWFVSIFGESQVDLEIIRPQLPFPRPVDVQVQTGLDCCSVWIIETQLHPDIRQIIHESLDSLHEPYLIIFLSNMHHPLPEQAGKILLSTTEREFIINSDFDLLHHQLENPVGGSLNYLDVKTGTITTYRDVMCIHKPQVFTGRILSSSLPNAGVDLGRGSIVHPREGAELEKYLLRRDHRRVKLEESRQILGKILDRMLPAEETENKKDFGDRNPGRICSDPILNPTYPSSANLLSKQAKCMYCGEITQDWWYLDKATGLCKCRDCLKKGMSY